MAEQAVQLAEHATQVPELLANPALQVVQAVAEQAEQLDPQATQAPVTKLKSAAHVVQASAAVQTVQLAEHAVQAPEARKYIASH